MIIYILFMSLIGAVLVLALRRGREAARRRDRSDDESSDDPTVIS